MNNISTHQQRDQENFLSLELITYHAGEKKHMGISMALISIIRHGETEHNYKKIIQGHLEIPLNETGRKQAFLVAKRLDKLHASIILSSDLERAKETAEIIKTNHHDDPEIIYHSALRERHLGKWEGKPFEEYVLEKSRNKDFEPEGAENFEAFWKRINQAKELIIKTFEEKIKSEGNEAHVIVVSHGGTIRRILTAFFFPQHKEPFPMRVDNASITQIEYVLESLDPTIKVDPGQLFLKTLNDTCHLEELSIKKNSQLKQESKWPLRI